MRRSRRIERLRELAHRREEALLRAVGSTRAVLAEELERLETLKRYRGEYESRFVELGRRGLGAAAAADYQRFVARLHEALRRQEQRVAAARAAHQGALDHWRSGHRRTESLGRLADRVQSEERHRHRRRAQAEADEAAARRALAARRRPP